MALERLDVRLDHDRRRKLQEMAAEQKTSVSETIRRLIDNAYDDALGGRRKLAAQALGRLAIEDVPGPAILGHQLESAHEPGGIH